jgi:glycosyltransferase involved in cell wall biosynthesis
MSTPKSTVSVPKPYKSVLFIAKNTHLGGAELALLALMKLLHASDLQLHLLTGESGTLHSEFQKLCESVVIVRLPYSRKPSSWLRIPQFCWQLLNLRRQLTLPVDCVANDFYETFATLLASFIVGASRSIGFWQSAYSFSSDRDAKKWTKYGCDNLDLRLASGPVASHLNALRQSEHFVVPFNPLVDESRFCATRYNRAEIRSRLNWGKTHHGVVVGRIGESKGQLALAQAFLKARMANGSRMENLRLLIVGPAGPDERRSLEILQQNSQGYIQYLGERSDIPELLIASDVALFPGTIPESFGLALHEAILIGTPVLALVNEGAVAIHLANSPHALCESLTVMIDKWATLASGEGKYAPRESERRGAVEKCGMDSFSRQVAGVFLHSESGACR